MNESKSIFTSKTFWGVIISLLGKGAGLVFGIDIDPETEAKIIDLTMTLIAFGTSFVGDALAIYGRLTASKKATITGK